MTIICFVLKILQIRLFSWNQSELHFFPFTPFDLTSVKRNFVLAYAN